MWITNEDGEQVEVTVASSSGWTIRNDGVVELFHEDENGREEWTEPLWRSPVREVFADWTWDLMDDAIDPRNEDSADPV